MLERPKAHTERPSTPTFTVQEKEGVDEKDVERERRGFSRSVDHSQMAHCLAAEAFHFIRVSGRLAPERTGEGAPQAHHARNKGVLVAHCPAKDGGQVVGPGATNIPCQWVGGTERADDCQKQPE